MDSTLLRNTEQRYVTIQNVDMPNNTISAIDQHGQVMNISSDTQVAVATVPAPDEIWLVQQRNHLWYLVSKRDDGTELTALDDLDPGDKRLEAANNLYLNGIKVIVNGEDLEQKITDVLEASVILAPDSSTRNVIQPINGDYTPLTLKSFASGTSDLIDFINAAGTTIASVLSTGSMKISSGTGSFIYNPSTLTGVVLKSLVGVEANDRFNIWVSGQLNWSAGSTAADVNLYRAAAGQLKTDTLFIAGSSVYSQPVASTDGFIYNPGGTSGYSFASVVQGEANPRFRISATGIANWGPGSGTATDTNLYRGAVNILQTDATIRSMFGSSQATLGNAYTSANNWMSGYFGGNIRWDGTNWQNETISGNNGWALWGTLGANGGMALYTEAASGASNRSYTAAQMQTKLVLGITASGQLYTTSGTLPTTSSFTSSGDIYTTGLAATRVGFLDPSGSANPTTYFGMYYDSTNTRGRISALSGGVAWRDVLVGENASLLTNMLKFGTSNANFDVNLYRVGTNALKTDDSFQAAGGILGLQGTSTGVVISSTQDVTWQGSFAPIWSYLISTGGGTLRSLQAPSGGTGTRVVFRNGSASAVTFDHLTSGGTYAQLSLRGGANVIIAQNESIELLYDGTNWLEIDRDQTIITKKKTALATVTGLNNGSFTAVTFGVIQFDDWGFLSTSANFSTIPAAGRYLVTAFGTILGQSGAGGGGVRIDRQNSSGVVQDTPAQQGINFNDGGTCSAIVNFNASDRIQILAWNGATGSAGTMNVRVQVMEV